MRGEDEMRAVRDRRSTDTGTAFEFRTGFRLIAVVMVLVLLAACTATQGATPGTEAGVDTTPVAQTGETNGATAATPDTTVGDQDAVEGENPVAPMEEQPAATPEAADQDQAGVGTRDEDQAAATPGVDDQATSDTETDVQPTPTDGQTASASEIIDDVAQFEGQTVTVRAPVDGIVNPNAFILVDDATDATNNDNALLVIRSSTDIEPLPVFAEGETIEATGVVRRFNLHEIEEEIGLTLQDDLFAAWADRPVLLADSIETVVAGGDE
jgi:hypothetical protein